MTIKGLQIAIKQAVERAQRSRESIAIVQIGDDEYVLWREVSLDALPLIYKHYKIVKIIRIQ